MEFKLSVKSATTGIILMTAYSYLISNIKNKNFREPKLLAILARRINKDLSKPVSHVLGWQFHYMVGLLFSLVYTQIWKTNFMGMKPNMKGGVALGAISGLIGISFWKSTFSLHPEPPKLNYKEYYTHLLLAHLLFGIGATLPANKKLNLHYFNLV